MKRQQQDNEWAALEPTGKGASGVTVGYSIKANSNGGPVLTMALSQKVLRAAKLEDGDVLLLQVDGKGGVRLARVPLKGAAAKTLHAKGVRGYWSIACTGDVAEVFGSDPQLMTALTLVSAADGVVTMAYEVGEVGA